MNNGENEYIFFYGNRKEPPNRCVYLRRHLAGSIHDGILYPHGYHFSCISRRHQKPVMDVVCLHPQLHHQLSSVPLAYRIQTCQMGRCVPTCLHDLFHDVFVHLPHHFLRTSRPTIPQSFPIILHCRVCHILAD